jgi:hypothetical protein
MDAARSVNHGIRHSGKNGFEVRLARRRARPCLAGIFTEPGDADPKQREGQRPREGIAPASG